MIASRPPSTRKQSHLSIPLSQQKVGIGQSPSRPSGNQLSGLQCHMMGQLIAPPGVILSGIGNSGQNMVTSPPHSDHHMGIVYRIVFRFGSVRGKCVAVPTQGFEQLGKVARHPLGAHHCTESPTPPFQAFFGGRID